MTAMTAGTVHNIGLAPITVGDTVVRSGGRLEVDDIEALGELPHDAYVVERGAANPGEVADPSPDTTADASPAKRRRPQPADEPAPTDADPGAGTDPAPQEPPA